MHLEHRGELNLIGGVVATIEINGAWFTRDAQVAFGVASTAELGPRDVYVANPGTGAGPSPAPPTNGLEL